MTSRSAHHRPACFFASAARGTEGVLRDELRELGLPRVRAMRGGVEFGAHFDDAMYACLHSRIAVRVLERVATFEVQDAAMLYERVRALPWERVLDASRTLAVRASVTGNEQLSHSVFAAQKVKDAIVDRLRQRGGARPNVDRQDPDVLVTLHVMRERAELLLDVSGEPLHRRGYRSQGGEAPLKETLAAAVLRFAGWDRRRPLIDPMCGSGTLAIEAAQWAAGIAPGLERRFGFERWADHDASRCDTWREMRDAAAAGGDQPPVEVWAADRDPDAVRLTQHNAKLAHVRIHTHQADVTALAALEPPGFVVINPPYGVRLETPEPLYRQMAQAFSMLYGHRIAVITPDRALARALRLRPTLEHTLYNGALECRLFVWDIPTR